MVLNKNIWDPKPRVTSIKGTALKCLIARIGLREPLHPNSEVKGQVLGMWEIQVARESFVIRHTLSWAAVKELRLRCLEMSYSPNSLREL